MKELEVILLEMMKLSNEIYESSFFSNLESIKSLLKEFKKLNIIYNDKKNEADAYNAFEEDINNLEMAISRLDFIRVMDCTKFELQPKFQKEAERLRS